LKRKLEEYINLKRSPLQNHIKTDLAIAEELNLSEYNAIRRLNNLSEYNAIRRLNNYFKYGVLSGVWHYFVNRIGKKHPFQNYQNPNDDSKDKGIYKLTEDKNLISLVSDWASDTPESDKIGEIIKSHNPDFTIHLGDTYYVGTKEEISNNFFENSSWHRGKKGSFALNGNHEMYARGISYFRDLLPTLGMYDELTEKYTGQKASYFCLENNHWRIIALDTAYNSLWLPLLEIKYPGKCKLENELLNWLENTLNLKNDKRGIIFLSHHQNFSAFEEDIPKPGEQLKKIIGDREVLWFWGHEHRLAIYDKNCLKNNVNVYGRCIGNGGMPVEIVNGISKYQEKVIAFDNRSRFKIKNTDLGFNGFANLELEGDKLKISYYDIKNELLAEENWKSNNNSEIRLDSIKILNEEISFSQTASA